jgi:hypothetical protein
MGWATFWAIFSQTHQVTQLTSWASLVAGIRLEVQNVVTLDFEKNANFFRLKLAKIVEISDNNIDPRYSVVRTIGRSLKLMLHRSPAAMDYQATSLGDSITRT